MYEPKFTSYKDELLQNMINEAIDVESLYYLDTTDWHRLGLPPSWTWKHKKALIEHFKNKPHRQSFIPDIDRIRNESVFSYSMRSSLSRIVPDKSYETKKYKPIHKVSMVQESSKEVQELSKNCVLPTIHIVAVDHNVFTLDRFQITQDAQILTLKEKISEEIQKEFQGMDLSPHKFQIFYKNKHIYQITNTVKWMLSLKYDITSDENVDDNCDSPLIQENKIQLQPLEKKISVRYIEDDENNSELLYFVYHNDKVTGPVTRQQVISLYLTKKFSTENTIYVKTVASADSGPWFSFNIPNDINDDDNSCLSKLGCCNKNKDSQDDPDIKQMNEHNMPYLYESVNEHILTAKTKLKQFTTPSVLDITQNFGKTLKKYIGRILSKIIAIILFLHMSITLLLALLLLIMFLTCSKCFWSIKQCFYSNVRRYNNDWTPSADITIIPCVVAFSGLLTTPFIFIYFILVDNPLNISHGWMYEALYPEHQSWMISWMVWGATSWFMTSVYWINLLNKNKTGVISYFQSTISKLVSLIFQMDVEGDRVDDHDIILDCNFWNSNHFVMKFIFPSLANLLPAAIVGFIVNFIWETRYLVKCPSEMSGKKDWWETCDLISSHDVKSAYEFIGGLTSNILAYWAFIRIIGFYFVHAYPDLRVYAKKKRE
eukprot:147290_1